VSGGGTYSSTPKALRILAPGWTGQAGTTRGKRRRASNPNGVADSLSHGHSAVQHPRSLTIPHIHSAWALIIFVVGSQLIGCASSRSKLLETEQSQVQLRSIQTRAFDTTDTVATLRAVMATLQDLGFVIDNADADLGTVSATKLDRYAMRMTVSVRPRGETQVMVRANAQLNLHAVNDPQPYQQFFDALSKSLFLAAQQVE